MARVDFESVHNYYERLVAQFIISEYGGSELAQIPGALEDMACLALNQLPARYVRQSIDTAFYLEVAEQRQMIAAVEDAVHRAATFVRSNPREPLTESLPIGELPE